MKRWQKSLLLAAVVTLAVAAVAYYFFFPALNVKSVGFWFFVIFLLACFGGMMLIGRYAFKGEGKKAAVQIAGISFGLAGALVVIFLVLLWFSSAFFNAKAFSSVLSVQEGCSFETDLAETLSTDAIAIMDTDSARMLGNRKIGSLTDLVSQYDVSVSYSQINYRNTPVKVAALDYAGFFKYMKNRENGIPGYVLVSPVDMSAQYVKLSENMQYVPSACFPKIWKGMSRWRTRQR